MGNNTGSVLQITRPARRCVTINKPEFKCQQLPLFLFFLCFFSSDRWFDYLLFLRWSHFAFFNQWFSLISADKTGKTVYLSKKTTVRNDIVCIISAGCLQTFVPFLTFFNKIHSKSVIFCDFQLNSLTSLVKKNFFLKFQSFFTSCTLKIYLKTLKFCILQKMPDLGDEKDSDKIDEYVKQYAGSRSIKRVRFIESCNNFINQSSVFQVLVANNGLAAVKCLISIRQWLQKQFDTNSVVSFVCIATEDEMKAASRKFSGKIKEFEKNQVKIRKNWEFLFFFPNLNKSYKYTKEIHRKRPKS